MYHGSAHTRAARASLAIFRELSTVDGPRGPQLDRGAARSEPKIKEEKLFYSVNSLVLHVSRLRSHARCARIFSYL